MPDLFDRAPDLKVVFSGGAGVDHVMTLPGLPDVPLVRFVDQQPDDAHERMGGHAVPHAPAPAPHL